MTLHLWRLSKPQRLYIKQWKTLETSYTGCHSPLQSNDNHTPIEDFHLKFIVSSISSILPFRAVITNPTSVCEMIEWP